MDGTTCSQGGNTKFTLLLVDYLGQGGTDACCINLSILIGLDFYEGRILCQNTIIRKK